MEKKIKNPYGGARNGAGNFSKYGPAGAKRKMFSLPAEPKKFAKAAAEINELLKKYHVK